MEIPSDEAGVLLKIVVPAGVEVPVGTAVAWVGTADETVPASEFASPASADSAQVQAQTASAPAEPASPLASLTLEPVASDEIMATPVAKRMARDLGIDLKAVGRFAGKQRVREADIRAYVEATARPPEGPAAPAEVAPSAPVVVSAARAVQPPSGETSEHRLLQPTPLQRTMAAHMAQAALVPQSAAGCEVGLSGLEAFRESLQAGWEKKFGFRLSYTHLIAALMARAVKTYPLLNASWTEQGIRLYHSVNLGVAMATGRGLVVPVVQRAHERSLAEVAQDIVRLQQAAQANRLATQDLQGGTVTLTNVGMLGIELSVPVLNPPQSAILGVGARRTRLTLENGQVKSMPVMSITLVSDHRLVDGAVQGAFLQTFREYLENPALALTV